MYISKTQIRVHYAMTDQMGVVYHGRYAELLEIGRVEAIRELGFSYKELEEKGIIMPVTELYIRYIRPARYDDVLTIITTVKELPQHSRVVFHAEIFNEKEELLTSGSVTLYFWDTKEKKKTDMPEFIREKVAKYF